MPRYAKKRKAHGPRPVRFVGAAGQGALSGGTDGCAAPYVVPDAGGARLFACLRRKALSERKFVQFVQHFF